MPRRPVTPKKVETLTHNEAKRRNIPTAEMESAAQRGQSGNLVKLAAYTRANPLTEGQARLRNTDLDPQIVWNGVKLRLSPSQVEQLMQTGELEISHAQLTWHGKDQQDWSDLIVQAPPLYIQEKIHPKAIIDNLRQQTKDCQDEQTETQDLFGDFNGLPDLKARTEFYRHDHNWSNRMILGDSLQVMASLAELEGLRGQIQCIYFDPPYGIKFNSNWQVSTRSRTVTDGQLDQITREPEQIKAFRDTWKEGIHSYLTYLRDRLTVMRDLLSETGSIFVQMGVDNAHRVRVVMDEVFGEENFICAISAQKTGNQSGNFLQTTSDDIIWYARNKNRNTKFRPLFLKRDGKNSKLTTLERDDHLAYPVTSDGVSKTSTCDFEFEDRIFHPGKLQHWKVVPDGLKRAVKAGRILAQRKQISWKFYYDDYPVTPLKDYWADVRGATGPIYVVQTSSKVVERCILMATDPGDLVLDPTCGSGTTAVVAEKWGRRWITIDTSRVALALARTRMMSSTFDYYLLADSLEGIRKDQDLTGKKLAKIEPRGDIRQGFVYRREPHVTLGSIARNLEIDEIWDEFQPKLEPLQAKLNDILNKNWQEWEIPKQVDESWPQNAKEAHKRWWEIRISRQKAMDKSIAEKADEEILFDQPYADTTKVRVSGPFTVENLSPHRVVPADEEYLHEQENNNVGEDIQLNDFAHMVFENLKTAGVQQAARDDRITFTSFEGWPGKFIAASGTYTEGKVQRRAAIFIGPEFGSVTSGHLNDAAQEALKARFDVLIACGFNFDARSSDIKKLGSLPILKAKMNPDLHMATELKNTGAGNLFVVFGEPEINWDFDNNGNIVVEVLGIDVFDPKTSEVRPSGKDEIAAWFIDTNYDGASFFVRHAYFLGANDPYKSLKAALRSEIDKDAWESLYQDKSQPFARPSTGHFAVKVINHFGDEVMKVFGV